MDPQSEAISACGNRCWRRRCPAVGVTPGSGGEGQGTRPGPSDPDNVPRVPSCWLNRGCCYAACLSRKVQFLAAVADTGDHKNTKSPLTPRMCRSFAYTFQSKNASNRLLFLATRPLISVEATRLSILENGWGRILMSLTTWKEGLHVSRSVTTATARMPRRLHGSHRSLDLQNSVSGDMPTWQRHSDSSLHEKQRSLFCSVRFLSPRSTES